MNIQLLSNIPTVLEFFMIKDCGEIPKETMLLFKAMEEVAFSKGENIVTYGAEPIDGMYIIVSGQAEVYNENGELINHLNVGDFIGEMGLMNDEKRLATVTAVQDVVCANISKALFDKIISQNTKIYGTFMNMLYRKMETLVAEQERIKSELAIATKIQVGCLEHDFSTFNQLENIYFSANIRPAKEVGGDFYDVFLIDDSRICFLVADVSGKGIPAALFMSMAKIHIKNYVSLGLSLDEVAYRVNNQLCYKNEEGMFVTAFVCVLNLSTNEMKYFNAGHNPPFLMKKDGNFEKMSPKVNLVLGMIENTVYKEQSCILDKSDVIYLYTDGLTEALNTKKEMFGEIRLLKLLNKYSNTLNDLDSFFKKIYDEIDLFSKGVVQSDDITMLCLNRR